MSNGAIVASIVTWNSAASIGACIASLLEQTHRLDGIYIFDNASHDDTTAVVRQFGDRVHLIESLENLGFCGGHNEVIRRTTSEFVLLVNPDIEIFRDYLSQALTTMAEDARIGAVCGLLYQDRERTTIDGTGLLFSRSRRFRLRDHGEKTRSFARGKGDVFGCDGALPLFRRDMINDVSVDGAFFDAAFFAHKEDHDVAWRSRLFGWRTIFDPMCLAIHPRVFRPGNLRLRRKLGSEIKYHAVKNDLRMLLKNEQSSSFWRDALWIVPKRIGIALYAMIFEPASLRAYWDILTNIRPILKQRRYIRQKTRVSAAEIREWIR